MVIPSRLIVAVREDGTSLIVEAADIVEAGETEDVSGSWIHIKSGAVYRLKDSLKALRYKLGETP